MVAVITNGEIGIANIAVLVAIAFFTHHARRELRIVHRTVNATAAQLVETNKAILAERDATIGDLRAQLAERTNIYQRKDDTE